MSTFNNLVRNNRNKRDNYTKLVILAYDLLLRKVLKKKRKEKPTFEQSQRSGV